MSFPTSPGGHEDDRRLPRRSFLQGLGAGVALAASPVAGEPEPRESAVVRLRRELSPEQARTICFPDDHPLKYHMSNNWPIVKATIGDMNRTQRHLCHQILEECCSADGLDRFKRQMQDDYGGFEHYHVAIFGDPDADSPLEWVLTGRHATLRVDGHQGRLALAGGPIFLGHSAPARGKSSSGNVWSFLAEKADAIYQTLDDRQRTNRLEVRELGHLQKPLVQDLLSSLVSPFRPFEHEAIQKCLEEGGADLLQLTCFPDGEIRHETCDRWKLEGPGFAWHFHGAPHVHAWLDAARMSRL